MCVTFKNTNIYHFTTKIKIQIYVSIKLKQITYFVICIVIKLQEILMKQTIKIIIKKNTKNVFKLNEIYFSVFSPFLTIHIRFVSQITISSKINRYFLIKSLRLGCIDHTLDIVLAQTALGDSNLYLFVCQLLQCGYVQDTIVVDVEGDVDFWDATWCW